MNMEQTEFLQGNTIEISEMLLKNVDNQLVLSWKIYFENVVYRITFYNVSRFSVGDWSRPVEIHGFEIIDHSKDGWGKASRYEIRDFEDGRVRFFCESIKMDE